jgi:hypothetical protein
MYPTYKLFPETQTPLLSFPETVYPYFYRSLKCHLWTGQDITICKLLVPSNVRYQLCVHSYVCFIFSLYTFIMHLLQIQISISTFTFFIAHFYTCFWFILSFNQDVKYEAKDIFFLNVFKAVILTTNLSYREHEVTFQLTLNSKICGLQLVHWNEFGSCW